MLEFGKNPKGIAIGVGAPSITKFAGPVIILSFPSQKELEIKKIIFSEANFNINKNSFYYINDFFKKKISSKKINDYFYILKNEDILFAVFQDCKHWGGSRRRKTTIR